MQQRRIMNHRVTAQTTPASFAVKLLWAGRQKTCTKEFTQERNRSSVKCVVNDSHRKETWSLTWLHITKWICHCELWPYSKVNQGICENDDVFWHRMRLNVQLMHAEFGHVSQTQPVFGKGCKGGNFCWQISTFHLQKVKRFLY